MLLGLDISWNNETATFPTIEAIAPIRQSARQPQPRLPEVAKLYPSKPLINMQMATVATCDPGSCELTIGGVMEGVMACSVPA